MDIRRSSKTSTVDIRRTSTVDTRRLLDEAHALGHRRVNAVRRPLLALALGLLGPSIVLTALSLGGASDATWLIRIGGTMLTSSAALFMCASLVGDRIVPYILCALGLVMLVAFSTLDSVHSPSNWKSARATCALREGEAYGLATVYALSISVDALCGALAALRLFALLVDRLRIGPTPRRAKHALLQTLRFSGVSYSLNLILRIVIEDWLIGGPTDALGIGCACWIFFVVSVGISPMSIRRAHSWLSRHGAGASSAAAIAMLIGGMRSPAETLEEGIRTLRCVPADRLLPEHFRPEESQRTTLLGLPADGLRRMSRRMSNLRLSVARRPSMPSRVSARVAPLGPDVCGVGRAEDAGSDGAAARPGGGARGLSWSHSRGASRADDGEPWVEASFGEIDVFVSHSWHDSPRRKWEAMQAWRRAFKAANHREPLVWVDRLCIDQSAIASSIQLLPVYLSGCRRLLCLCGESYFTRLWCLVELFVFVETGGHVEDIDVLSVREDGAQLGVEQITFDVRDATCSSATDTDRLLATIEASFDGADTFNARMYELVGAQARSRGRGNAAERVSDDRGGAAEPCRENVPAIHVDVGT
jgi:hypothetical protein